MSLFIQYINRTNNNSIKNYGQHCHKKDELIIVRQGKICVNSENLTFTQNAPCCILYKKNSFHNQENVKVGRYERYCIQFNKTDIIDFYAYDNLFVYSSQDVICIPLNQNNIEPIWQTAKTLQLIKKDKKKNDNRHKYLLTYLLTELLNIYEADNSIYKDTYLSEPYLSKIKQYVSTHIKEKMTIDSVASKFGVGRTKLITDFRKCLHTTFYEYVTSERLKISCELLEKGLKCNEIAENCGFTDASHFIRTFKKHFNLTPDKFRKNNMK